MNKAAHGGKGRVSFRPFGLGTQRAPRLELGDMAETGLDMSDPETRKRVEALRRTAEFAKNNADKLLAQLRDTKIPLAAREATAQSVWQTFPDAWPGSEKDKKRAAFDWVYGSGLLRWIDNLPQSAGFLDMYLSEGMAA